MTIDILVITHNSMPFHGIQERLGMNITFSYATSITEAIWKIQMHSFCLTILDISF